MFGFVDCDCDTGVGATEPGLEVPSSRVSGDSLSRRVRGTEFAR
jgi:hypothetical protein